MFNPKMDMRDTTEREPPPSLLMAKKNKWLDAKILVAVVAAAIVMAYMLWSSAHASSCVSESSTDVASQNTILFKKKC